MASLWDDCNPVPETDNGSQKVQNDTSSDTITPPIDWCLACEQSADVSVHLETGGELRITQCQEVKFSNDEIKIFPTSQLIRRDKEIVVKTKKGRFTACILAIHDNEIVLEEICKKQLWVKIQRHPIPSKLEHTFQDNQEISYTIAPLLSPTLPETCDTDSKVRLSTVSTSIIQSLQDDQERSFTVAPRLSPTPPETSDAASEVRLASVSTSDIQSKMIPNHEPPEASIASTSPKMLSDRSLCQDDSDPSGEYAVHSRKRESVKKRLFSDIDATLEGDQNYYFLPVKKVKDAEKVDSLESVHNETILLTSNLKGVSSTSFEQQLYDSFSLNSLFEGLCLEDPRDHSEFEQVSFEEEISSAEPPNLIYEAQNRRKSRCKSHACYFCGSLYTNLRKHWRRKHMNEALFQKALKEAESSRKGKHHRAFSHLMKMGDFKHNKRRVLEGDIFVPVRASDKRGADDYVCCVRCKGYYIKDNYARHRRKNCPLAKDEENASLIGMARIKTHLNVEEAHPLLKKCILPHLTRKKQLDVLFNDPAAIALGNILCEEQLSKPEPSDLYKYVSSQLRLLADLLNEAKSLDSNIKEIDDLFHPDRYLTCVEAIKKRGHFKNGVYETPFPAMQSCTMLTKLCRKLKTLALAAHDEENYSRYHNFETIMTQQQNSSITKVAAAARITHRRKKMEVLPTTDEVNQLSRILETECKEALQQAKLSVTVQSYANLAKALLARILVINRRRPGDVHKTTIDEFLNYSKLDQELIDKLKEGPEKEIASNLYRYVTKGKLNKTTANLVTTDMVEGINFLIEHRREVGLTDEQTYLFANPKAKRAPFYRADDALKNICLKYGLQYNHLRATQLRKHLATSTANMDQNTQSVISDFMGHSYNIHQGIYQVRQIHTDISIMGRILYNACGYYQSDTPSNLPATEDSNKTGSSSLAWLNDESDEENTTCLSFNESKSSNPASGVSAESFIEERISNNNNSSTVEKVSFKPSSEAPFKYSSKVFDNINSSTVDKAPFKPAVDSPEEHTRLVKEPISCSNIDSLVAEVFPTRASICLEESVTDQEKSPGGGSVRHSDSQENLSDDPDWQGKDSDDSEIIPNTRSSSRVDPVKQTRKYKFPFKIEDCNATLSRLLSSGNGSHRTWRTPHKHAARAIFKEYLDNQTVPSLNEIQLALNGQDIQRTLTQIQCWIRAEISRQKEEKKGRTFHKWTTPQKKKLRQLFHKSYKTVKAKGKMVYPSQYELQKAADTVPEFENKTPAMIKSKLQHEFKNINFIAEFNEKTPGTTSGTDTDIMSE